MGVRHAREYADILKELTEAIGLIDRNYTFFEMEEEEWKALGEAEQGEVLEALADDVFFGLGEQAVIPVGDGVITYNAKFHVLEVSLGTQVIKMIRLT
ncbi:hypothetical protein ACFO9Q_19175 [Paenibacillus sp. GCM10023252]|uniref:hypothetical protein n=1 Tax=Paenibacillus sp. GCM10023252 TaxID=3252649 RepID=UPI00361AF755